MVYNWSVLIGLDWAWLRPAATIVIVITITITTNTDVG